MLLALLRREVTLLLRDTGLMVAFLLLLAGLAGSLLADFLAFLEPSGVGATGVALQSTVARHQWVLTLAFAPWIIHRIGSREPPAFLVRFLARVAVEPWKFISVRLMVAIAFVVGMVCTALPLVLVSAAVGDVGLARIFSAQAELALFLVLVVSLLFHGFLRTLSTLSSLGLSYAGLGALVMVRAGTMSVAGPALLAALTALATLFLVSVLVFRGRRWLLTLEVD